MGHGRDTTRGRIVGKRNRKATSGARRRKRKKGIALPPPAVLRDLAQTVERILSTAEHAGARANADPEG